MDWRDIPSLAALRAFEAAARTGSLSAAARELNVTHAAISQHVRTLETHFGRSLIARDGQRMMPTEPGTLLSEALSEGFGTIRAGVQALRTLEKGRPLRIALPPSFAASWLMPRMGEFWMAHPAIDLELLPSPALVDLRRDQIDLAIRFGRGGWPGVRVERLMDAGYAAVARAGLVGEACRLADLCDVDLIVDSLSFDESRLFLATGGITLKADTARVVGSSELAVQAARAGLGVAILPEPYVRSAVASGELDLIARDEDSDFAYHLLTLPGRDPPGLAELIAWLRANAA